MNMTLNIILIALATVAALVALEARDLRRSLVAWGVGGVSVAAALFVVGGVEVSIGVLVAVVALAVVFWWALRRTAATDSVNARRLSREHLWVLGSLMVALGLFLAVAVPLFRMGIPAVSHSAEGISGVSVAREALVLAVAGVAVWALARAAGRRER